MGVDAVTAEVTQAFSDAGVPSLLLKGPTIARWLYDEEHPRSYADTDLLVDPARLEVAAATLRGLGFRRHFRPGRHAGLEAPPAYTWTRAPFSVDLHDGIPGARGDRQQAWDTLSADASELRVGGQTVRGLGRHALLAHVTLHAAHHGPPVAQPLTDLGRALAHATIDDWATAARLADEIGASDAFARGLGLLAEGRQVLIELGIDYRELPSRLYELERVPLTAGLGRLAAAPGALSRVSIVMDELVPTREFMWWWAPLARRSRRGLAAAYLWRLAYMAWRLPWAVVAWRRFRAGR